MLKVCVSVPIFLPAELGLVEIVVPGHTSIESILRRLISTKVPTLLGCQLLSSRMSATPDANKNDWHSSKKISKRASYILKNPDEQIPSDVTFSVGNGDDVPKKIFKCHKFILALVSSMFQAQFYGTFPLSEGAIGLPDITPAAFQNMLNYAYTDSTDGLKMDNVVDTLYCAKKYLISKLARACRDFVQDEILGCGNLDHIWSIFEQAQLIGEDNLAAIALAEICHRTKEALEQPDFLSVSLPSLKAVLERDNLSVSEPTIYEAVARWALEHGKSVTDSLRVSLGPLLYCIRFTLFSPTELANGPCEANIFTDSEEKNLYRYLFGDKKPAIPFSTIPRTPSPATWTCYIGLFTDGGKSLGQVHISMRPDWAPACCQYLKNLIDGECRLYFCNDAEGVHNNKPNEVLPVPSAVSEEVNFLAPSKRDAVWFEWEKPLDRLYVSARCKPVLGRSAVFGHVDSAIDRKAFDSFFSLCEHGMDGHVKFSLEEDIG